MNRGRVSALVAMLGLVLTGCSAAVTGVGSPGRSTTATGPNPTATSGLGASGWVRYSDQSTGISYLMPPGVALSTRPTTNATGVTGEQRLRQTSIDGGVEVGVGIVEFPGIVYSQADLAAYPRAMTSEFQAVGSTDFAITELHTLSDQGHAAIQFRISFTPLDRKPGKSIWLVRAIAVGDALVLVQTIAFPQPSQETVYLTRCRAFQAALLAGLKLP